MHYLLSFCMVLFHFRGFKSNLLGDLCSGCYILYNNLCVKTVLKKRYMYVDKKMN